MKTQNLKRFNKIFKRLINTINIKILTNKKQLK